MAVEDISPEEANALAFMTWEVCSSRVGFKGFFKRSSLDRNYHDKTMEAHVTLDFSEPEDAPREVVVQVGDNVVFDYDSLRETTRVYQGGEWKSHLYSVHRQIVRDGHRINL